MPSSYNIYLAGPVNGTKFSESVERNRSLGQALASAGMVGLDPLDFEGSHKLLGHEDDLDHKAHTLGITTPEKIVEGCLGLIDSSHAMLIDLRGYKTSGISTWGTPAEMMYAVVTRRIPVVAIADDFTSAWLSYFCTVVPTLEEALDQLSMHRSSHLRML